MNINPNPSLPHAMPSMVLCPNTSLPIGGAPSGPDGNLVVHDMDQHPPIPAHQLIQPKKSMAKSQYGATPCPMVPPCPPLPGDALSHRERYSCTFIAQWPIDAQFTQEVVQILQTLRNHSSSIFENLFTTQQQAPTISCKPQARNIQFQAPRNSLVKIDPSPTHHRWLTLRYQKITVSSHTPNLSNPEMTIDYPLPARTMIVYPTPNNFSVTGCIKVQNM